MTDIQARALSLGIRCSEALTKRYAAALAWRKAHPGEPVDPSVYFQLRDHDEAVKELRRIERTMTARGAIKALTGMLERLTGERT